MNVLALNSGSSSLKFGLFRITAARTEILLSGAAESIGNSKGKFVARDTHQNELISVISGKAAIASQGDAIIRIARLLAKSKLPPPAAIGHRIVHGGPKLRQHCLIDESVMRELEAAAAFAPLHTPAALSVIRVAQEHFPGIAQVACFDTAFHADLPEVARVLPIPKVWQSEGIQRYGFHGLSYESIMHHLANEVPERIVIAHLGNGASVTAVKHGKSIDTSMGLTPTGGVIMSTRSGDLDPGVLTYLIREKQFDAAMIEELVDHHSGLLGISGISSDMRTLHEAAASNSAPSKANARLAIQMFCISVRKQVAAMIAVLDGVDLVVFTGGIGENDAEVRAAICEGLSWIGVSLDRVRNQSASDPIQSAASRCSIRVLASQEDEQIARHTWSITNPAATLSPII